MMKNNIYLLVILNIVCYSTINAQEPRPDWVRQPPYPPKGANFIYSYGMGEGKTEQEAELNAWKNALYKAFSEGGLIGIKEQSRTLDDIFSMNDLEVKIPTHVIPRRLVCQSIPIFISKSKIKIFILLQVKLDGAKATDFYDYEAIIKCESQEFNNQVKDWNNKVGSQQKLEVDSFKLANRKELYNQDYITLIAAGIMVQKKNVSSSQLDFESAKILCENSIIGGYKDWRLPTKEELAIIFNNKDLISPFPTYCPFYWSNSPDPQSNLYYYAIDIVSGSLIKRSLKSSIFARAVRTVK